MTTELIKEEVGQEVETEVTLLEKVEMLRDDISMAKWAGGAEGWKVTEVFNKSGTKSIYVEGLECENEQGLVFFGDYNDSLLHSEYVASGFLMDSIKAIHYSKQDKLCVVISFEDGAIKIEEV